MRTRSLSQSNTRGGESVSADAVSLKNAQALDLHLFSTDAVVVGLTEEIYDSCQWPTGIHRKGALKHLQLVLLNLYAAWINDPERYVRFARRPANYRRGRYNPQDIGYKHLVRVIDVLAKAGYLTKVIGIPGRRGFARKGKQTRMRANQNLVERFAMLRQDMIETAESEVIIQKEEKDVDTGKALFVDYRDTRQTRDMRSRLQLFNREIAKAHIDLFIPDAEMRKLAGHLNRDKTDREPIDFRRTTLRRVFNNGRWNHGGRFYQGWWQEIPREYRGYR